MEDFNILIAIGTDIAVTHSTFLNSTEETMELIKDGEYILILDEALDAITEFNSTSMVTNDCKQKMSKKDMNYLLAKGSIKLEENKLITWLDEDGTEADKFSVFARLAKAHRLYYAQGCHLLCIFPPEMFSCFKEIYIMTYLFEASLLKCYFDLYNIEYETISIKKDGEQYSLCDYDFDEELQFRQNCKELISIFAGNGFSKHLKYSALSKTWYENNCKSEAKTDIMKKDLRRFFESTARAKAKDIMWTCPEEYMQALKGKGYTITQALSQAERALPKQKREEKEKCYSCFIPLNARASNDFSKRWALAYYYNMNIHPYLERWLEKCGVDVNKDLFSISCMIQWIFRSRIRNGEPIMLYLPSPRMRSLFNDWLEGNL